MTTPEAGTVLITGPTRGLGRATALALAGRPDGERPDLLLVGRPGAALDDVAGQALARRARVHAIGADLARLADVRAAATAARELLDGEAVRPLRALIANAGAMSADTRRSSADGYELTNVYRRLMGVPAAGWRDPLDLARPATGAKNPGLKAAGVAYSNAKLAVIYYAHELQRQVVPGVNVVVFEPGWMPGTGLGRGMPAAVQAIGRGLGRLPGVATAGTLRRRAGLHRARRAVVASARRRVRGAGQGDRGAADRAGPRTRTPTVAGH